jgi:hypothetical protein
MVDEPRGISNVKLHLAVIRFCFVIGVHSNEYSLHYQFPLFLLECSKLNREREMQNPAALVIREL